MSWRVAIPSYARAPHLRTRTLATLARGGVPADRIDVWVADTVERDLYRAHLLPGTYADLFVGAGVGMDVARNSITAHYPNGASLVQMDDDVTGVFLATGPKTVTELLDLCALFDDGFEGAKAAGARLWGLYPVCNAFFMHGRQVTTDLRPIIGTLHGLFNDRAAVLKCAVKSDIERTLLYFERDRAVFRFNNIAPRQRAHDRVGGLAAAGTRTFGASKAAADELVRRWPAWVVHAPARARAHAEVRLLRVR